MAESKIPLKRTVMFLSFGAEEQAIMGAKAYLDNPSDAVG
ncbi:MAG: M28 family peptidase [Marinilabiliales bacterium]|nr:M28 family peptidase [Marinilabiliales bacterium]